MVWGARAPLSLVPGPLGFSDHKIWWVVSEDNPFSSGPIVCSWAGFGGRPGVWAGLSPVSRLVTSEAGTWRVVSYGWAEVDGPKGLNFFLG